MKYFIYYISDDNSLKRASYEELFNTYLRQDAANAWNAECDKKKLAAKNDEEKKSWEGAKNKDVRIKDTNFTFNELLQKIKDEEELQLLYQALTKKQPILTPPMLKEA